LSPCSSAPCSGDGGCCDGGCSDGRLLVQERRSCPGSARRVIKMVSLPLFRRRGPIGKCQPSRGPGNLSPTAGGHRGSRRIPPLDASTIAPRALILDHPRSSCRSRNDCIERSL
jgi:hypothetical protein